MEMGKSDSFKATIFCSYRDVENHALLLFKMLIKWQLKVL